MGYKSSSAFSGSGNGIPSNLAGHSWPRGSGSVKKFIRDVPLLLVFERSRGSKTNIGLCPLLVSVLQLMSLMLDVPNKGLRIQKAVAILSLSEHRPGVSYLL